MLAAMAAILIGYDEHPTPTARKGSDGGAYPVSTALPITLRSITA